MAFVCNVNCPTFFESFFPELDGLARGLGCQCFLNRKSKRLDVMNL